MGIDELLNWFSSPSGNAVAGWLGLLISIVGFGLTITAARESKLAAKEAKAASERAANAAQEAVERIGKLDVFGQLTEVASILAEVTRMERETVSPAVKADRYLAIRNHAAQVRATSKGLTSAERATLQSIITNCKVITEIHERAFYAHEAIDTPKILATVGDMQQEIAEIASKYRQRISLTDDKR